jgi:hypothetical protein
LPEKGIYSEADAHNSRKMWYTVGVLSALAYIVTSSVSPDGIGAFTHTESHGVKFVHRGTILAADEFEEADLLLPFPTKSLVVPDDILFALESLQVAWEINFCPGETDVQVDDAHAMNLLEMLKEEISAAGHDLDILRTRAHTAIFEKRPREGSAGAEETNNKDTPEGKVAGGSRQRRSIGFGIAAAGIVTAAVVAAPEIRCFLRDILGPCDSDKIQRNQAMISKTYNGLTNLRRDWVSAKAELDGKFFVLGQHLTTLGEVQEGLIRTQEEQWNKTQEVTSILAGELDIQKECINFLVRRTLINHLHAAVMSLMVAQMTQVAQYRAVLYDFQNNLMDSIGPLGKGELPLSLVPVQQLQTILGELLRVKADTSSMSLSIPLQDTHLYYNLDLVRQVSVIPEGVVISLAIPFASGPSKLAVYLAIALPMLVEDDEAATIWDLESEYIAVVEGRETHALISPTAFARCRGTPELMTCPDSFALYTTPVSCIAALYLRMNTQVLEHCGILGYNLPSPERATDLGDGQWLLESTVPAFDGQIEAGGEVGVFSKALDECRVCLITLLCGSVLQTKNLRISANAHTCVGGTARVTEVTLAVPLQEFFRLIPKIDVSSVQDFPEFRADVLKGFQMKIRSESYPRLDAEEIKAIAKPLTDLLVDEAEFDIPWGLEMSYWKPALIIGFLSFLVTLGLQGVVSCIQARRARKGFNQVDDKVHDLMTRIDDSTMVHNVNLHDCRGVQVHPQTETAGMILKRLNEKILKQAKPQAYEPFQQV